MGNATGEKIDPQLLDGIACYPAVLTGSRLTDLAAQVDAVYQPIEAARKRGGIQTLGTITGTDQRFVATASSLTLGAVLSVDEIGSLCVELAYGPAGEWISQVLGCHLACCVSQAWVRRQYAPANYPPLHSPHSWHQDGALCFNFLAYAAGQIPFNATLDMVTCWIPLCPCGADAPGLELVRRRLAGLLLPAELVETSVRQQFGSEEFWRPVLNAGDTLLFCGDILHRTYVTQAMTKDRTSIELRLFPADKIPKRLNNDCFRTLP